MDTSTYEILKECNSGCRMALNSIEQLAVYLKSQELQDLFCKYKEDYEKMEKESIRLSEGKLQEEKLSEKAAETFAWISAEVKMMLNDDSSKIAEMMIDGANMGIKSITEKLNRYSEAEKESISLAKKFENTGVCVEDLISIGTIGLIKGINTFNPEKKIKLATYASRCIENEILMYLRRNNRVKLEVSFDEPLNTDWDGNELLLSDILGTDEDVIYKDLETEVEISLLKKAMLSLSERERQIIELRFGVNRVENKELTQKEVADILGISQSYISRLEKKIMARLKKEIQKMA